MDSVVPTHDDPTVRLHRNKWSMAFVQPFEAMYRDDLLSASRSQFRVNAIVFLISALVGHAYGIMTIPHLALMPEVITAVGITLGLSVGQFFMTFHRRFWGYYDVVMPIVVLVQHGIMAKMSYTFPDLYFLSVQPGMLIVVLLNCTIRLRFASLVLTQTGCVAIWLGAILDRGVYVTATGKPFAVTFYFVIAYFLSLGLGRTLEQMFRRQFAVKMALGLERENSENLLRNVMPDRIATRIKSGEAIADFHGDATVMFTDLAGFTRLASERSPRELVAILNDLYSRFDDLSKEYGLEKLKTIGDAYMAVAGLQDPHGPHAASAADCALAMLADLQSFNAANGTNLSLRIGLHTGPLIAGIIGKRQFSYDVWGDTVNIASRMESHGELNRIQISEATYKKICLTHACTSAGEKVIKGKGVLSTWFVEGRTKNSVAA